MEKIGLEYLRVSTDDQEGGLDTQDYTLQNISKEKEIPIKMKFVDEAISGAEAERDGFINLQLQCRSLSPKKFKVYIYVYDLSRIGRDPKIGEDFIQLCWKWKITVIDRNGHEHTFDTWEKRLFARMVFSFNTGDKEKKNDDSIKGQQKYLTQGRWLYGVPPGYKWIKAEKSKDSYIDIDQELELIIRTGLEMFGEDELKTQKDLSDYFSKFGLNYGKDKIARMVRNPIYAGLIQLRKDNAVEIEDQIQGNFPALIDVEVWDLIQDKLAGRKKKRIYAKPAKFRNIFKCATCGSTITPDGPKRNGLFYYKCNKVGCANKNVSVREEDLENQIEEILKNLVFSTEAQAAIVKMLRDQAKAKTEDTQAQIKALQAEHEQTSRKIEKLLELRLNDELDSVEFLAQKNHLKKKQSEILEKIKNINQNISSDYDEVNRLFELTRRLPYLWKCSTILEKNKILNFLLSNSTQDGRISYINLAEPFSNIYKKQEIRGWWSRRESNAQPSP